MAIGHRTAGTITDALVPMGNAAFGSLAFYSLLQDSGHHDLLPWMVIVFAAIYLGLMRLPQTRVASAVHLSLAVVFLTIAIPLKASGRWITIGWLAEGVALLWVATRLAIPTDDTPASVPRILRRLAVGALTLGLLRSAQLSLPLRPSRTDGLSQLPLCHGALRHRRPCCRGMDLPEGQPAGC